ncbi:hypothetical protein DYB28_001044 [Aphanomyces astaci]|uniref:Uncharacterized protein n=1 Tax=Aphanomyces astaci TaxID=112090 RepID=A0A9X8H2D6_APHAT|nr:hypothetical protein DYB28_001044 [Aphanomyces astaci]
MTIGNDQSSAVGAGVLFAMDELIKLEKAAIARLCALVYASLSPTVQRDVVAGIRDECAHCIISSLRRKFSGDEQKHTTTISVYQRLHTFKFKPYVSLDVNLQAFDKIRTAVEKLEGRPLSDSHLASALLAALPDAPDLFIWRGAQPSIPYNNMRQLLEQHWSGLVIKYPHYLCPAPIAVVAPVHGSATATAITWSSALALPAFETTTDKRPPYPGAPKAKTTCFDYGTYRDDQRGRSPFRQSASCYRSGSGERYRDYREDHGYYREDRGYYRDDRGSYRADSGANQDDRRYRSRSPSMYASWRHRSRSAPYRHPPPSAAKAAARRAALPVP